MKKAKDDAENEVESIESEESRVKHKIVPDNQK